MPKRLTSTAGTGRKILNGFSSFEFEINHQKSKIDIGGYFLDISFNNISGYMTFDIEDEIIKNVNIDFNNIDFGRTLGSNNDETLLPLAKRVASDLKIL